MLSHPPPPLTDFPGKIGASIKNYSWTINTLINAAQNSYEKTTLKREEKAQKVYGYYWTHFFSLFHDCVYKLAQVAKFPSEGDTLKLPLIM